MFVLVGVFRSRKQEFVHNTSKGCDTGANISLS
jgi:hypothetical protein